MFKTVLFDLDGTITEPFEGITNSILYALEKLGVHGTEREKLKCFIGPPLVHSFAEYFGFSKEKSEEAVKFYREYYSVKGIFECNLFAGIVETLSGLKRRGITIGLATGKPEPFAIRLLEHFSIKKYFNIIAGATFDSVRNEKAAVIDYALGKLGYPKLQTVLMVGDRRHDVEGAKANKIACAGVTYGYGDIEELKKAGAKYIINSPEEILTII